MYLAHSREAATQNSRLMDHQIRTLSFILVLNVCPADYQNV